MTCVVEATRAALGCQTDTELAERLGIRSSNLSNWKKAGKIPDNQRWRIVQLAREMQRELPPEFYVASSDDAAA